MVAEHAPRVCAVAVTESETLGDRFGIVDVCHVSCPERGDGDFLSALETKGAVEG